MRAPWALLTAVPVLVGGLAFGPAWETMRVIFDAWWVLPLGASSASVSALAITLARRRGGRGEFSTQAYLAPGPAMAAMNLLPAILPVATVPAWATVMMPALFLVSAWLFYHATGEPGESEGSAGLVNQELSFRA